MRNLKLKLIDNLDIILFSLFVPTKLIIFSKQLDPNFYHFHSIFYSTFASIFILACINYLFFTKKRSWIFIVLNIIITLLIIINLNYFRYFKDILSVLVLRNIFQLASVESSVSSIFKIQDLLYLFDIFIIFFLKFIFNKKAPLNQRFILKKPLKKRFAVVLPILIVAFTIETYSFYSLEKEQPRLLTTLYNKVYVTNNLGIVNFSFLDFYNFLSNEVSKHTYVSKDKETEIENFLQRNSQNKTTDLKGSAKGKNLIIIQVEALQQFVIDKKVMGTEITPNLNKLIKRSAYFNNYFYQIAAGGTSDAEFMSNNSLYPAPSGAAYFLYSSNDYLSLPKVLAKNGYETAALHGYNETFWNRNIMYKDLGFQNFFSEKSYNINEKVGLGLSDKEFLTQSIDKLHKLSNPYYAFLITLSSHYPYDDIKSYGAFNVGKYENSLIGNYIKSIHYTDAELGIFLDKLQADGTLDNSILAIYGDHYAIPKDKQNELGKFMNINNMTELQWTKLQKVPLIVHFPKDANKGLNEVYGGQMDLYPTLSNLYDLPNKNQFGKDLFNSKGGNVVFRNGSFTDGTNFYLSQNDSFYSVDSDEKLPQSEILKAKLKTSMSQLEYSDEILKHNLLKKYDNSK